MLIYEVTGHEQCPYEFQVDTLQFWKRVLNIERGIEGFDILFQSLVSLFKCSQQSERIP
jgi:hypothetical protein